MNKLFKRSNQKRPEGIDPDALRRDTRPERYNRPKSGEALGELADRLHELAVLSLFLHSAGTLEEMLAIFLERSRRVTGAVVTYPLLLDRRRDLLSAQRLASVDDSGLEQASIAANESLADMEFSLPLRSPRRDIMEAGEVVVRDDLREFMEDVIGRDACDAIRAQLQLTSVAAVPLVMEGEAFGLCIFMFAGASPDVEILELTAGHCTLALKAMMIGEEATRYGGIDPVTWAHSRGFFLEALEVEVVRAKRYGRGLSLAFFDIDDFGEFNKNFGHTLGDRLLRSVAMTMAGSIAMPELVARYGGDDFALLLPESNRAAAVEVTAQIVNRLSNLSVFESDSGEKQGFTTSVAIVSFPEDGSSREELLAAAEMGLAQAKEERRLAKLPPKQLTAVQQLRLSGRKAAS